MTQTGSSNNPVLSELDLLADLLGSWKKAVHGTHYDYEYISPNTCKLYINTEGDYKVNYLDRVEKETTSEFILFNLDIVLEDGLARSFDFEIGIYGEEPIRMSTNSAGNFSANLKSDSLYLVTFLAYEVYLDEYDVPEAIFIETGSSALMTISRFITYRKRVEFELTVTTDDQDFVINEPLSISLSKTGGSVETVLTDDTGYFATKLSPFSEYVLAPITNEIDGIPIMAPTNLTVVSTTDYHAPKSALITYGMLVPCEITIELEDTPLYQGLSFVIGIRGQSSEMITTGISGIYKTGLRPNQIYDVTFLPHPTDPDLFEAPDPIEIITTNVFEPISLLVIYEKII